MDKLARWYHVLPAAPAWAGHRGVVRALRSACVVALVAAPVLGACPTLQRAFDHVLYEAALDLVQDSFSDDDPWRALETAAPEPAGGIAKALDDSPRPVMLAAKTVMHVADAMDLLSVSALRTPRWSGANDVADDDAPHPVRRGAPTGRALFSMMAANTDLARDDAPFQMPPATPPGNARPRPYPAEPIVVAAVAAEPAIVPPTVLPIAVLPVAGADDPLLTSVPPVIPPAPGVPPITVVPESTPIAAAPPMPGSGEFRPPVPPVGGGKPGPGDGIVPGPAPARPLPEPATAWLLLLALVLARSSLRPAPRAPRTR